jgi:hypothetical protein
MQEILEGMAGRRTATLHGLGGIGKTQLATTYIRRHRTDYSAAIWLNARDETAIKQSFVRTAERIMRQNPSLTYLSTAMASRDPSKIVEAVQWWLDDPINDRWLLIYDNYDDPLFSSNATGGSLVRSERNDPSEAQGLEEGANSKAFDIQPYLPKVDHGAIIVTTRSSVVNLGQRIKLSKLQDISDSLEILAVTSCRENLKQGKSYGYRYLLVAKSE